METLRNMTNSIQLHLIHVILIQYKKYFSISDSSQSPLSNAFDVILCRARDVDIARVPSTLTRL